MKSTENYVEPKAAGETGDEIDSVRIARILNGMAIPLGGLIAAVGIVSACLEGGGRAGNAHGLVGGTCLILGAGLFLVAVGATGMAAIRRLSRR